MRGGKMTTEHRIPGHLFLVAGDLIEEALRRDTSEAIAEFKRDGSLIATWEDGQVVIISGHEISQGELFVRKVLPPRFYSLPQRLSEGRTRLFYLLLSLAQKMYINGEELRIEYPQTESEIADFLRSAGQDMLHDLSRIIAGREMSVSVRVSLEASEPEEAAGVRGGFRHAWQLNVIAGLLRSENDLSLASQVEALTLRLDPAGYSRMPPHLLARLVMDEPLTGPRTPGAVGPESDDALSRKSKE
ncbi:MAG TPA: hypothetical protein VM934_00065 [Pyrinomonadaceae bacterium]|nr:hypothetical protein [Pyrinomonadaceae bacterium]